MATIRPRTVADLNQCARLMEAVYASDGYPVEGADNARAFLADSKIQAAWIAEAAGKIIGHVCINTPTASDCSVALWQRDHGTEKAIAVLGRLFVSKESRTGSGGGAGGVATDLVQAAVAWARERQVRLVLFALTRIPAPIRFYDRLGWERFGEAFHECSDGRRYPAVCFTLPVDKMG